jgi:hypothetical protein
MKFGRKDCGSAGTTSPSWQADSILIDEARTRDHFGASEESTDKHARVTALSPSRRRASPTRRQGEPDVMTGDYVVDENTGTPQSMTRAGKKLRSQNRQYQRSENWISSIVETAVKARAIYKRDVDYAVKDASHHRDGIHRSHEPGRRQSGSAPGGGSPKGGRLSGKSDIATITFRIISACISRAADWNRGKDHRVWKDL